MRDRNRGPTATLVMFCLLTACLAFSGLAIGGCAGNFSQARADSLEDNKLNHSQDVDRALKGELTAVELRASLDELDKQILAEHANKGNDAELETLRVELEAKSDKLVAGIFNGDTGRPGSTPDDG